LREGARASGVITWVVMIVRLGLFLVLLLCNEISLGLQGPIPKRGKEMGQLAELTHMVCELSLELEASAAVLCYTICTTTHCRCT
jgi:hypothetical protein